VKGLIIEHGKCIRTAKNGTTKAVTAPSTRLARYAPRRSESTIYKQPSDVNRFVEVVRQRGDSERDALGFLPRCVYSEAAAQGKLLVATATVGGQEFYAGHLLFGGKFPHLRVFQLYVAPEFRHRSIGGDLVSALATDAEMRYYITISARVAADLPANEFWERVGFRVIRTEQGGATTGRVINVRRRELDSQNLFNTGLSDQLAARMASARVEQPIFALDLNVLLDVIKDRPRAEHARRLLTASMSGLLRLFVAREFVRELTRAAQDPTTDPVIRLAITLPQFTEVPDQLLATLKRDLADILFPSRVQAGELRVRDHSDLLHLATMIYHSASGFVTSDEAILRRREELRAKYGIDVVGPAELAEIYIPSQWTAAQANAVSREGMAIEIAELTEVRRREVEMFLISCSMPPDHIARAISSGQSACPRHRVVVSFGNVIIGFASWEAARGPNASSEAWLTVEPAHTMADLACDVLFEAMSRDVCAIRPASVVLRGDLASREVRGNAEAHGFRPASTDGGSIRHEKFCVGAIITPDKWIEARRLLSSVFSLDLPFSPPAFSGPSTMIMTERRNQVPKEIALADFETQFSPVILMLTGRPVIVVPIQRNYADQLLNTASQAALFPALEASVRHERLYLSSPRTLSVLTPGAIILFYESIGNEDGRGAIIAAAQIVRTALREVTALDSGETRRGVLSPEEIVSLTVSTKTALTFFNQLMRFEKPVTLSRLRKLGCADGANFVTARRIGEGAATTIIEEGKPSVRLS
jgi:ribosomal protein S18 acetylase RimI-like enzyme/predicted nucleic acid-binding protein